MHLKEVIKVLQAAGQLVFMENRRRCRVDFPRGPVAKTLASSAQGPGSIPGQGTRSHMPQLRAHILQLKISSVATKTWYSQISKYQNRTYSSASRSLAGERGHPWLEFPILTSTLRSGWLQDPSNQPRKRRNHIIQRQREVDC